MIIQWGSFKISNVEVSVIYLPLSFENNYVVISLDRGAGRVPYASEPRDLSSFTLYTPIASILGGSYIAIGY